MVFVIQNTQNRDTVAMQIKLDELIRVSKSARNALLDLEELDDKTLEALRQDYEKLASQERRKRARRAEKPGDAASVTGKETNGTTPARARRSARRANFPTLLQGRCREGRRRRDRAAARRQARAHAGQGAARSADARAAEARRRGVARARRPHRPRDHAADQLANSAIDGVRGTGAGGRSTTRAACRLRPALLSRRGAGGPGRRAGEALGSGACLGRSGSSMRRSDWRTASCMSSSRSRRSTRSSARLAAFDAFGLAALHVMTRSRARRCFRLPWPGAAYAGTGLDGRPCRRGLADRPMGRGCGSRRAPRAPQARLRRRRADACVAQHFLNVVDGRDKPGHDKLKEEGDYSGSLFSSFSRPAATSAMRSQCRHRSLSSARLSRRARKLARKS